MASSDKKLPHRGLGGFTLQHDQRDCGVACLLSLVRYYGGNSTFEHIRRLCGADLHGTTLLGLKEAANQLGFEAEGYESDVQSLIEHGEPTILHVELEGGLQHYVVWYSPARRTVPAPEGGVIEAPFGGLGAGLHFIGDPARGWWSGRRKNLGAVGNRVLAWC